MINLNTPNKLSIRVKLYVSVKILILVFLLSLVFLPFGGKTWFSAFRVLIVFFGLLPLIYFWIYFSVFSFIVDDNKITINSGIIIKRSRSIAFNSVQNITNVRGVLHQLFSLSRVNIWTASPSQINIRDKKTENKPDGILELDDFDGEWLKNFIFDKRSK